MSTSRFDQALQFVLQWEGGYVNHPSDPGGATNRGITQRTYDAYRARRGLPSQDVRYIPDEEVRDIYYNDYWIASGANNLPPPLDIVHFDTAVHSGPGQAQRFLQQVTDTEPCSRAERYLQLREEYLRKIVSKNSRLQVFMRGWMNRLNSLRTQVQNHPRCRQPSRSYQDSLSPVGFFTSGSVGCGAAPCTQLYANSTAPAILTKDRMTRIIEIIIEIARSRFRSTTKAVQKPLQCPKRPFTWESANPALSPPKPVQSLDAGQSNKSEKLKELEEALQHPNVRAMLQVIRYAEGTTGDKGYQMLFGGETWSCDDSTKHPNKTISKGGETCDVFTKHPNKTISKEDYTTTAAGAYQFLSSTWEELVKQYGFQDFSPHNQDLGAVALIKKRGALEDVKSGRFREAIYKISWEWASLPGPDGNSRYGRYDEQGQYRPQPAKSIEELEEIYKNNGGQVSD
jgi:muramidase (phage lysozyme)